MPNDQPTQGTEACTPYAVLEQRIKAFCEEGDREPLHYDYFTGRPIIPRYGPGRSRG